MPSEAEPEPLALEERRRAYDQRARSYVGRRLTRVRYGDIRDEVESTWGGYAEFDWINYGPELSWDDGRVVVLGWGSSFTDEVYSLDLHEDGFSDDDEDVWDVSQTSRWTPLLGEELTDVRVQWIDEEDTSVELSPRASRLLLLSLRAPMLEAGMEAARDPSEPRPQLSLRLRLQQWLGLRLLGAAGRVARLRDRSERERLVYPLSIELAFGPRRVWVGVIHVIGVDGDEYELFQGDDVSIAFDEEVARKLRLVPAPSAG